MAVEATIRLRKNTLGGTLPTELGSAAFARRLGTQVGSAAFARSLGEWVVFVASISTEASNALNLVEFDVSDNVLEGTIPSEFGRMLFLGK